MEEFFGKRPDEAESLDSLPDQMLDQATIGQEDVDKALATFQEYKNAKANLENQIIENERWYQMRHWEMIRSKGGRDAKGGAALPQPDPASAWLFNSLVNKHADAMDNIPEANVLPRERSDEESAKQLGEIVPVVMERAGFEDTYSANWWEKLKHGTGVYAPLWDPKAENGLGEIAVKRIDLLNIFWEPGIEDIQDSRNLFLVNMVDNDVLQEQYPVLKDKLGKGSADASLYVPKYIHDDQIDTKNKTAVIDWYYKVQSPDGRTVLQYAKIANSVLLYASQNEDEYRDTGWYHHGQYPVVFDSMFPEKGFPTGFGYVSICKDPQLYIDKLQANIMENSLQNSKIRFLVSDETNINENELRDYGKPIVHVAGRIDDAKMQQLVTSPLDGAVLNAMQMKIDEMKETSSNRDVSQGGTSGGATAAAAIAALQEAGNKVSRDIINASFRAYTKIGYMVIELIRQFYDERRTFRITGENGDYQFVDFSNKGMLPQPTGMVNGMETFREPIYDIKIKAQKRSPFAREAQNQRALELYSAGFFNPDNATPSLACLEMMEFEGIDKVRAKVSEGQTLLAMLQQTQAKLDMVLQRIGMVDAAAGVQAQMAQDGGGQRPAKSSVDNMGASQQPGAQPPETKYMRDLSRNAVASV